MYYAPIEKSKADAPDSEPKYSLILGMAFLLVALPYWGCRLLTHWIVRDVRRLAQVARMCGTTYAEARRRD